MEEFLNFTQQNKEYTNVIQSMEKQCDFLDQQEKVIINKIEKNKNNLCQKNIECGQILEVYRKIIRRNFASR